jgi:hypothetical protein
MQCNALFRYWTATRSLVKSFTRPQPDLPQSIRNEGIAHVQRPAFPARADYKAWRTTAAGNRRRAVRLCFEV